MKGHQHAAPFPRYNPQTHTWDYRCGCGLLLRRVDYSLAQALRAHLTSIELLADYGTVFPPPVTTPEARA